MRILVDEMPEYPSHCLFSEFNCREGGFICMFKKSVCTLENNSQCPYLIAVPKKASKRDIMDRNRALNAERRQKLNMNDVKDE